MDSIALWFASTLGQYVSKEVVIFIISMIPILELRGRPACGVVSGSADSEGDSYLYHR